MTVHRNPGKSSNYSIIANEAALNPSIDPYEKGVLWILLTKPPGWETSIRGLCSILGCGRDKAGKTLNALESAGYVARWTSRNSSGHIVWHSEIFETIGDRNEWIEQNQDKLSASIHEIPIAEPVLPVSLFTGYGSAGYGSAISGKPGHIVRKDPLRTELIKTDHEQPENFSESDQETKPSPVNKNPIVETIRPTTTKGKATPLPPSGHATLPAEIMAVYAKFKPSGWVDTPTRTTALEMAFMRVIKSLPDPSELIPRIEMALKFAQEDFSLKQKVGTIDDLFKFNNLVEWSDKGKALEKPKAPAVPQEELDRRQVELRRQIKISQVKSEAKRNWIDIHYPDPYQKLLGEGAWNRLSDTDKKNVETIYIARLELVHANRRRNANNQNPAASVQERRELAAAGGDRT